MTKLLSPMRPLMLVVSIWALAFSVWANDSLDPQAVRDITVLCEQLYADYAVYRDQVQPEAFANTFTEDGVLALVDESIVGRDALQKYIADHPLPPQAHMIMMTTTEIDVASENHATGVANAIVLAANRSVEPDGKPVQMSGITGAMRYHTKFENTEQGWKIAEIALERAFRGPGSAE